MKEAKGTKTNEKAKTSAKAGTKVTVTPEIRFPKFRDKGAWKIKRLGDVCKIIPSVEKLPEAFFYIDLKAIDSGELVSKNKMHRENAPSKAQNLLKNGDIIYQVVRPHERNSFFCNFDDENSYVASTEYAQLRALGSNEFLYQLIQTDAFVHAVIAKCNNPNYPAIDLAHLSEINVAMPSLPEQQKIADCFTSLDKIINAEGKKLIAFKDHKRGLLQKILPGERGGIPEFRFPEFRGKNVWKMKTVGDIFETARGEVLSKELVKDIKTNKEPYPVYSFQTKDNGLSGFHSNYLYENAITWVTDGTNAGNVNYREGKFYCTSICGVLLNSEGYANSCVAALINRVAKRHFSYFGKPKLLGEVISKIRIPLPSLLEQQKITECITSIDKLISAQGIKLINLKDHKRGLLQKLFPPRVSILMNKPLPRKKEKVKINPQRLDWCLKSFNMSLEDLRQECKINIKETDDEILLTFKQLDKVAKYFNEGILFFLSPQNITDNQIHSIQFRTINKQNPNISPNVKKIIERAEVQRERYIGFLEELSMPLKKDWKPGFSDTNKENRGKIIRNWLGLNKAKDFDDVRKSIEDKGIIIFRTSGYKGNWHIEEESPVRGFSLYYEILPVIVVKKQASRADQTFALIYQLAHSLIHQNSYIDTGNDLYSRQGKEKEANELAGKILVPDEALLNIVLPENVEEYDFRLKEIAKDYCVNAEVILRRLLTNQKITPKCYKVYRSYKSTKQNFGLNGGTRRYPYREPLHVFGQSFVNVVFSAYYEKHITLSKASSYLDDIKISDIHKLEKYFVQL